MGNKINANGFRVGVYHKATRTGRGWNATWFPAKNKDYAKLIKAVEIRDPDIYANVVADSVRRQLEARKATRRIMKQVVDAAIAGGAKGCKLEIAGRVDGAEIARTMKYSEGSVPRHTLRANVDFGFAEAWTKYGILGVKVWIYRGDED